MNIKDFSDRILRTSVIRAIESGRVDNALLDPDVLDIISSDKELMEAFVKRIPALKSKLEK